MPYFELAELRARDGMGDVTKYSDADLTRARAWIEALIERECGTSFIGRARVDQIDGTSSRDLVLPGFVLSVTSVSVDGVAFTAPQLADLVTYPEGRIRRKTLGIFAHGDRNVTVSWSAGYTAVCPDDLKDAAILAARDKLLREKGPVSMRTLSYTSDLGESTRFATASSTYDRPTGVPDVDVVIVGWRNRVYVPSVAAG